MNLFEHQRNQRSSEYIPLAARMRPRSFNELIGQEHIIGSDKVLRRSIENDQIPSAIFWGPPGSGKTTLAMLISSITQSHFEQVSAVTAGVADLRRIIHAAKDRFGMHTQRTILFVDEIHRFNKAQQDVLLPHIEDGSITFICATTENPSFEVIGPLLSRCRVFTLNPLTNDQVGMIVDRALTDTQHGVGNLRIILDPKARDFLVTIANGDARIALNTIELASSAAPLGANGAKTISMAIIEDALQQRSIGYDKKGDQHYDTISAYIKSVRASDPDAAVYWLARMLEAGEDPMFIARRIVILAAEDIGIADPHAISIAVATQQAVHFVGMPEGKIPLAEATIYLATAPKSNSSYVAITNAINDVRKLHNDPVPMHLRNPVTPLMKNIGYGKDYKYSHDYPDRFTGQNNLPNNLRGHTYYQASDQGYEKQVAERIHRWWKNQRRATDPIKEDLPP
jgi:putative ATPase